MPFCKKGVPGSVAGISSGCVAHLYSGNAIHLNSSLQIT